MLSGVVQVNIVLTLGDSQIPVTFETSDLTDLVDIVNLVVASSTFKLGGDFRLLRLLAFDDDAEQNFQLALRNLVNTGALPNPDQPVSTGKEQTEAEKVQATDWAIRSRWMAIYCGDWKLERRIAYSLFRLRIGPHEVRTMTTEELRARSTKIIPLGYKMIDEILANRRYVYPTETDGERAFNVFFTQWGLRIGTFKFLRDMNFPIWNVRHDSQTRLWDAGIPALMVAEILRKRKP